MKSAEEIAAALAEPFDAAEVKWKPQAVSGSRALAVAFVDARVIQDRLDEVLGVEGWSDDYECLADGSVVCRLRLRLGDEWVTKVDVGGPSEQQDAGDRMKAAFSDALKRAAVKFGIGRYLYRLPMQWVDYDPQKKQFVRTPKLPAFALPRRTAASPSPKPAAKAEPPKPEPAGCITREVALKLWWDANARGLPLARLLSRYDIEKLTELPLDRLEDAVAFVGGFACDAAALAEWLTQRDGDLSRAGKCKPDELIHFIQRCAEQAGERRPLEQWGPISVKSAIESAAKFAAEAGKAKQATA